ncbi:MAG: endonuclease/exonuclease/phosphatase family protein [bacterium]
MKLLQINIWQGRLMKNFLKLIDEVQPDFITFQELCSSGNIESKFFNNVEELEARFNYSYKIFTPALSWSMMSYKIDFGNAIYSKYPIVDSNSIFTNLQYKDDFDLSTDDYNIRNLVDAKVDIGGKIFHILTHHGIHVHGSKEGDEETFRQIKMIENYVSSISEGIIITGDFNLSPRSKSLEVLNNKFKNLCIENNISTTRNEFASTETQVCDYIFTNDKIQVNEFEVSNALVSDHAALILDFEVIL